MTRPTFMVVPRSHQHLEMGQRHTDIPRLSGYNFSCWLLQRNQLSFPQGSTTRWTKIASQWFLPAWQCIFLSARAPQGRKVLTSQNGDGSHHQISAGALERPIWQCGKGSSIFLKVLLLFMRTVKQTWHEDKEELTFPGY